MDMSKQESPNFVDVNVSVLCSTKRGYMPQNNMWSIKSQGNLGTAQSAFLIISRWASPLIEQAPRRVQRYSSTVLQGFKHHDLGDSPGWWAATVSIYCPSRPSQLPKENNKIGRARGCTILYWHPSLKAARANINIVLFPLSGLFYLPLHDLNHIPALRVLLPPPRGNLLRRITTGAGNRRKKHLLSRE